MPSQAALPWRDDPIMRLPPLKFLRTFQVAATRQSFKLAAEELFVTPSAVSHQIKALEEQLGVVLFERGPRSLTLTEAGRSYLQHLETVFARLERVTEQLQIRQGRSIVRLRIPPFFATELLLPRLLSFLEAQPDTDIQIDTAAIPAPMHTADADLSIVVGATPEGGHACHKLFSQTFVPACSPTLLQRTPIDTVSDLNRHTLIVHEARRDGWQRWSEPLGIELHPRKLVRFDTMHAAAQAAEHGVGVALVSAPLGNERFMQGSLVKLFDTELQTGESYFLVLRNEDATRPDVRALEQWILEQFSIAA
jgi:LysR family transcriptional regulator, glycine cleavage system transcriptional activator